MTEKGIRLKESILLATKGFGEEKGEGDNY